MRLLNQKQPGRFWREVAVCPVACASSMPYNHLALGQAGSKTPAAQHLRDVAQFGSAPALGAGCRRFESCRPDHTCGRSSMVEPQPSKLMTRVRFPSPAPEKQQVRHGKRSDLFLLTHSVMKSVMKWVAWGRVRFNPFRRPSLPEVTLGACEKALYPLECETTP